MAKNKKITIESLAGMIKRGFDGLTGELHDIKKDIEELKRRIGVLEQRFGVMEEDIADIKIRLGNAAWGFEVRELERRVNRLEKKAGIK
jgi:archaellum component FlaC